MLNLKAINERSIYLGNVTKANDKAIADHCIVIAQHIVAHGDVTPATVLCDAFGNKTNPSGIRVNGIREWFLSYGGCSWNADKKAFGKKKAGTFSFDIEAAKANPWYTLRPEPEFKPVDLEKLIKAVIKKASAALEDLEHAKEHSIDKVMLAKLEAMLTDRLPHYVETSKDEPKDEVVVTGEMIPVQEPAAISVH